MIGIVAPVLALDVTITTKGNTIVSACFHPGGQGANVARAVRSLGEKTVLTGFVGGEAGTVLSCLLKNMGISCRLITTNSDTKTVLTLDAIDEPRHILQSAISQVSRHEADDLFSAASILVLQSRVMVLSGLLPSGAPADFFARLVHLANQHNIPCVVDIAPELLRDVLTARPTLVKPNLHQLRSLLGRPLDGDQQEVINAIEEIQRMGAQMAVVSMGNSGALAACGDAVYQVTPPIVPTVAEAGAGDSMVAGLAVSLARGYSLEDMLILSTAAGSASVLRRGMASFKAEIPTMLREKVKVEQVR